MNIKNGTEIQSNMSSMYGGTWRNVITPIWWQQSSREN